MQNLLNIVKKFKDQKVLVIGDLMIDEYISGEANRISPEAPILILDVKKTTHLPGGAANVAYNIKSLGAEVFLTGVIGPDEKGEILKKKLEEKGIGIEGIIVDLQRKTTIKTRVMAKNQQVVRIDNEDKDSINFQIEEKLFNFVKSRINQINSIIISDYNKGVITPSLSQKIISLARQNNILCFADPKGDYYEKYRGCSLIKPNENELARVLNIPIDQLKSESKFLQAGKMLLSHTMCENILVSRGEKGMVLFEKNGNCFNYAALNKQPVDVSGAGDTAMAILALASANGNILKQSIILASHACAIEVGKIGTAAVSIKEIETSLLNYGKQN